MQTIKSVDSNESKQAIWLKV